MILRREGDEIAMKIPMKIPMHGNIRARNQKRSSISSLLSKRHHRAPIYHHTCARRLGCVLSGHKSYHAESKKTLAKKPHCLIL